MRLACQIIFAMAVLSATLPVRARAEDAAIYLATYIEIVPNAVNAGATLLQRYRDASRGQSGCLRFDVLREIARPERFAILEVWSDEAARDVYDKTTSTTDFRDRLTAIQGAPYDERVNVGLYLGPVASEPGPNTIYVLTHVDLISASKDQGIALLKTMQAASSQEAGNLAYEVLQQANRPNHFTVVEEWANTTALDAHAGAQHTRAFRQALQPMEGAPYDERRYQRLR